MKIKIRTYAFGIVGWIRNTHHFLLQTFTKQSHTHTGHINLLADIICPLKNDLRCDIHVSELLKTSFDSLIENVVKGLKNTTKKFFSVNKQPKITK